MAITVTAVAVVAALVGYIAGVLAYRTSIKWCRSCGDVLHCPSCSSLHPRRTTRPGRAG